MGGSVHPSAAKAIAEAASALPDANGWRPIQMATVGDKVLQWCPNGGCCIAPIAEWQVDLEARKKAEQDLWRLRDVALLTQGDEGWVPTHWQPLPDGPVSA